MLLAKVNNNNVEYDDEKDLSVDRVLTFKKTIFHASAIYCLGIFFAIWKIVIFFWI